MQKSSVNKVILVGHIGNKPEGRYTPSGASTANFSLATNESWIDSENQKQERTEWHNIIAWNKLADFATEYLQKGQLIYIEGRMQTHTYKDKEDIQRRVTDVVSTTLTPLEWKTADKKANGYATKMEQKDTRVVESTGEEDLPF